MKQSAEDDSANRLTKAMVEATRLDGEWPEKVRSALVAAILKGTMGGYRRGECACGADLRQSHTRQEAEDVALNGAMYLRAGSTEADTGAR